MPIKSQILKLSLQTSIEKWELLFITLDNHLTGNHDAY